MPHRRRRKRLVSSSESETDRVSVGLRSRPDLAESARHTPRRRREEAYRRANVIGEDSFDQRLLSAPTGIRADV
jgi:hypothetical protein